MLFSRVVLFIVLSVCVLFAMGHVSTIIQPIWSNFGQLLFLVTIFSPLYIHSNALSARIDRADADKLMLRNHFAAVTI